MRLKKYSLRQKILIGKKIKNICEANKVCFLINDDPWLANKLGGLGIKLKAGEIILSGALSAMFPVKSGDELYMEISQIINLLIARE